MIRINLAGIRKEIPRGERGPAPAGAKLAVIFVVILALGVAFLGWHYTTLQAENTRLTKELQDQEAEKQRLARVKTELEQFEKAKALLIKRHEILEALRKSQSGPVSLLNTLVGTVVAQEQLWLTSFQNDGLIVSIDGVAGSVNAVADFINRLKASGLFKSVEIRESFQSSRFKEVPTFDFSISAELVPSAPALTGAKT